MKIDYLSEKNIEKIKPLITNYEFNDYRNYRGFKKEVLDRYLFGQIADLVFGNKDGRVIVIEDRGRIAGLVSLIKLPWDTEHFGFGMAKIGHLIASGLYRKELKLKNSLISFISQLCKSEKILHLSCRVDTCDFSSIHALEANGFRIMDTLVTYLFNRAKHKILNVKGLYTVRTYEERDLETLIELARTAFLNDRFHVDPNISNKKADELCAEWTKNYCRSLQTGKVLVAERKGRVVGFLAYKLNKDIENLSGYKIAGQGLSAVSVRSRGVYPALVVKASLQDGISLYDFGEFDTQINNYEVIRIWQWFGFDFVRSKYTFHKWFGNGE